MEAKITLTEAEVLKLVEAELLRRDIPYKPGTLKAEYIIEGKWDDAVTVGFNVNADLDFGPRRK